MEGTCVPGWGIYVSEQIIIIQEALDEGEAEFDCLLHAYSVQRPDLGLLPLFGVSQDDGHHAAQLSVGRSTLLNITNLIAPLARWPTSLRCKIFDVLFFCSHSDLHIDLSPVPNHHAVVLLMALKHNFIYARRAEG